MNSATPNSPNLPLLLIVDDSPANLHVLATLLRDDYRIKTATDGPTALALAAKADRPQLILLDMMMPGMDGAEVLVKLREQPETAEIPVIFVTADTSEKSQVHSFELGADDYLTKPVVASILLARVRNILHREALEKETRRLTQEVAAQELLATQEQLAATRELLARSSKLEFLGKLVASFAHDIGGPIGNCITTNSTLHDVAQSLRADIEANTLKRSALLDFVNDCERGIGLSLKNLERAQQLLNTLKQQAQDQATSQTRHIQLKPWLEDLLLTMSPVFKKSPHRCLTAIPLELELTTQPGPLSQVLVNLINNALIHAFEGQSEGTLRIGASRAGDQVELSVEDDGCGMSAELQAHVFEAFFTTKGGRGGTGLGLDIVRHTVENVLRGTLQLVSAPGEGSRFVILLPDHLTESP